MGVGRLKIWNETTDTWDYVAPGLQGPTGPVAGSRVQDVGTNTFTPNVDNYDLIVFTGEGDVTVNNPTGTPSHGQKLMIQLLGFPNPVEEITFGNAYGTFSQELPLPTVVNGSMLLGFMYRDGPGVSTKWDLIAVL